MPEVNYIDREVFAKLQLLNMVPSDLAADDEFLRRVTIDTIGQLPTPDEVRAFLADKDPNKREKKIDELLAHPLHAALWATKFSRHHRQQHRRRWSNPQQLQPKRSQMWHDWLRKRVADNMPYDQIVRGILTATSRDGQDARGVARRSSRRSTSRSAKGFDDRLRRARRRSTCSGGGSSRCRSSSGARRSAAAFLGVRLECAQCHKHPTDRWTQDDYWAFANVFAQVTFANNQFSSPEVKKARRRRERRAARRPNRRRTTTRSCSIREMFVAATRQPRRRPNPATEQASPTPKALGGPGDRRRSRARTRA